MRIQFGHTSTSLLTGAFSRIFFSDFRRFVISIIKENYLVIPGRSPQELTPVIFIPRSRFFKAGLALTLETLPSGHTKIRQ